MVWAHSDKDKWPDGRLLGEARWPFATAEIPNEGAEVQEELLWGKNGEVVLPSGLVASAIGHHSPIRRHRRIHEQFELEPAAQLLVDRAL